jgi:anti-sigma-K factor RskA
MNRDQLEFQISQYLDGTLNDFDRRQVEALLERDPEAQQILREYQKLDAILRNEADLPAVDWDRFARHISEAVAAEEPPAVVYRMPWARVGSLVAAAATVVIGLSLAGWMYLGQSGPTTPELRGYVQVTGPVTEAADGGTLQVTLGPGPEASPAVTIRLYEDEFAARPSRLMIAGVADVPSEADRLLLPF